MLPVVAGAILMLATGCGSSSTALSEKANRQLRLDVLAVTEAAAAKDTAAAAAALIRLHTHVVAFQESGDLSSDRAVEIDAAATKVADGLDGLVPTTAQAAPPKPSTSSTTSSPTSAPKPVEQPKDKGKGHGHG